MPRSLAISDGLDFVTATPEEVDALVQQGLVRVENEVVGDAKVVSPITIDDVIECLEEMRKPEPT